jgi:hypothetical protein
MTIFNLTEIYLQFPKSLFVQEILSLLPYPLVTLRSRIYDEKVPVAFKDLPYDYINAADFVCEESRFINEDSYSVAFTFDLEGNLIFKNHMLTS